MVETYYRGSIVFWSFFLIIHFSPSQCLGDKLPIISSIFPIADMIRQVGGEHVDVVVVLPAGASPHTFEPKPSLIKKISSAKIFFMVGVGLEFWAQKMVSLSGAGLKTVVLSKGIPLIHATEHFDGHETHHGKNIDSDFNLEVANPHIWLNPIIAKSMVNTIITALSEVDNRHLTYYNQQGQLYLDELDKLDDLIRKTVASFRIKKYVSFHASWDYFARQYGLQSVGVIEAAPGRNPTPALIKNIVASIKKYEIKAVFAEPQLNPRAAEVIANEANVKFLMLDPMGGPKLAGRNSYVGLMKYNLNVWKEAME
jgi:zinc transport system substrate-binding protein